MLQFNKMIFLNVFVMLVGVSTSNGQEILSVLETDRLENGTIAVKQRQQPTQAPIPRVTLPPNHIPDHSGSMIILLQHVNDRLTTMEALERQKARKLDTIDYRLTKMEIMEQDKGNALEKVENQIIRKIETLDWEINKIVTLLGIVREDLEKLNQGQQQMKFDFKKDESPSKPSISSKVLEAVPDLGFSESTAKLQVMQTTLQSLRRMTDTLQDQIGAISENLTSVHNKTSILVRDQNKLVTKQYLLQTLQEMVPEQQLPTITLQQCSLKDKVEQKLPKDCTELQDRGIKRSGVHQIQPAGSKTPFFAYCDLKTDGGGWTVIQKRQDGSINFLRDWRDYKYGFGNLGGEHWLGNEKLYHLTNQDVYELRFELEDFQDEKSYAVYSSFAVGPEAESYMIKLLGSYEGTAGDSFSYHTSMKFSTPDMDNDPWEDGNCAELHTGGWWYNGCDTSNLNGQYLGGQVSAQMDHKGMYWYEWHGPSYSLRVSEIKIRINNFHNRKRKV